MSQPIGISGGVEIRAEVVPVFAEILTPDACRFLPNPFDRFEQRRQNLLAARPMRQAELSAGTLPDFLPGTAHVRARYWSVEPVLRDLADRRVPTSSSTRGQKP